MRASREGNREGNREGSRDTSSEATTQPAARQRPFVTSAVVFNAAQIDRAAAPHADP